MDTGDRDRLSCTFVRFRALSCADRVGSLRQGFPLNSINFTNFARFRLFSLNSSFVGACALSCAFVRLVLGWGGWAGWVGAQVNLNLGSFGRPENLCLLNCNAQSLWLAEKFFLDGPVWLTASL